MIFVSLLFFLIFSSCSFNKDEKPPKVTPDLNTILNTVLAGSKTGVPLKGILPKDLFRFRPAGRYISRRYSIPSEEALYTSLSRRTAINEVKAGTRNRHLTNEQVNKLFHISSKNIEVDNVLDLTNNSTRQLFKVGKRALTEADIATRTDKDLTTAYQLTHIIGHIAKRKGFKAIKAPSAHGGTNVISFVRLE